MAAVLALGAALPASAQDDVVVLTGRAYPFAIHAGTCNQLIPEPSYDLGFAQPRPMIGVDDDGVFTTWEFYPAGDDRPIDENTVLLTGEDLDDGIADYGFDRNESEQRYAGDTLESLILPGGWQCPCPHVTRR